MVTAVEHVRAQQVEIPAGTARLSGDFVQPEGASAIVLFAHGSGSSRHSPRNRFVAGVLQRAGMATLLFDLLTPTEEQRDLYTREHRFDIALLTERLVHGTAWVGAQPGLQDLAVGYFGASTGSAAALFAAARLRERIGAVVSRGGRPDLADAATLARVTAPTLLIVGGYDDVVIDLNRQAYAHLRGTKDLVIVPGASHLFEEPGTLEAAAQHAAAWFARHLAPPARA
jgi:putative phosphoribosyl transferase